MLHAEGSGNNFSNPFDEDDVGKRFALLKQQMNLQENDSTLEFLSINSQKFKSSDPAAPASGVFNGKKSIARTMQSPYTRRPVGGTVNSSQVNLKVNGRRTPTKGGESSQIKLSKSIDQEPVTVSYNTKVFNKEIMALRGEEEVLLKY